MYIVGAKMYRKTERVPPFPVEGHGGTVRTFVQSVRRSYRGRGSNEIADTDKTQSEMSAISGTGEGVPRPAAPERT